MKKVVNNPFITDKVKKTLHLNQVNFLKDHPEMALRLQLDNLVLTYGLKAVQVFLENTQEEIKNGTN